MYKLGQIDDPTIIKQLQKEFKQAHSIPQTPEVTKQDLKKEEDKKWDDFLEKFTFKEDMLREEDMKELPLPVYQYDNKLDFETNAEQKKAYEIER